MNINLTANAIEETDRVCEIKFNNREDALSFAKDWSRKTMMGHVVKGSVVKVFNVTKELKNWIDNYVNTMNMSNEDFLKELGL